MKVKDQIKECEINLKQIKRFDPDPYYVNYFFNLFIKAVNNVYECIFEEANSDFGLFIVGKCTKEKFLEKARLKDDHNAIKFLNWFENKTKIEHKTPYPNFIKYIIEFENKFHKLPKIKIMIRPKERYSDDKYLEIKVNLANKKLRSIEELDIEIKRNIPIFLEIINQKRLLNGEPKITSKEITVGAFMENHLGENFEVAYASEIYISIMDRIVKESQEKIKMISNVS